MANLIVFIIRFYMSICSLLMLSVLTYIILYNWLIPNYSLTESVFFHHDVSCTQLLELYQSEPNQLQKYNQRFSCQNVHYDVPNKNYRRFFKSGHVYYFELQLQLPDSQVNRNLGMFMIGLSFLNSKNEQIYEIFRPAILPYTSSTLSLFKLISYLPLYLIGYFKETYTLNVMLLDEHADVEQLDFGEINRILLEIDTMKPIEITPPSKLFINVHLRGVKYLMYFWPITSSIFIIGAIFSTFFFIYCCSILKKSKQLIKEVDHEDGAGDGTQFFGDVDESLFEDPPQQLPSSSSDIISGQPIAYRHS